MREKIILEKLIFPNGPEISRNKETNETEKKSI